MVIYTTNKYWTKETKENEIKIDTQTNPIFFNVKENIHVWDICFLHNSTLVILFYDKNELEFQIKFYKFSFSDVDAIQTQNKKRKMPRNGTLHLLKTKSLKNQNLLCPYKLFPLIKDSKNSFLIISENRIDLLHENNNFEVNQLNISLENIQGEEKILITGICQANYKKNEFLLCTNIGDLFLLFLNKENLLQLSNVGDFNTSGSIQSFHENYILLCGELSDNKMLELQKPSNDNEIDPIDKKYNLIYEIPNWCPILDFCPINYTSSNDVDRLYACGGTQINSEIVCFRNGLALDTIMSSDFGDFYDSIKNIWCICNDDENPTNSYIIMSFIQSTKVLLVDEEDQMEDISINSGFNINSTTICAGGNLKNDLFIQITTCSILICSIKQNQIISEWKSSSALENSSIINASIRNNEILLVISNSENTYILYFHTMLNSSNNKYEPKLINKIKQSEEVSCVYLPNSKYCHLSPNNERKNHDIFSIHEMACVATHKPSLDIYSLTDGMKISCSISLQQFSNDEENVRVHSIGVFVFEQDFLISIGLREGSLLLYKLEYNPIINDENNEASQQAQSLESQEESDIMKELIHHKFSVSFISSYQIGIHPVTLIPIQLENNVRCIILSDKTWIMGQPRCLPGDDNISSTPNEFVKIISIDCQKISALTSFQSQNQLNQLLVVMDGRFHISQLNFSNLFTYHQITQCNNKDFNFTGPFKKIIYTTNPEPAIIILCDSHVLAFHPSTGILLASLKLPSKSHCITLWEVLSGENENNTLSLISIGMGDPLFQFYCLILQKKPSHSIDDSLGGESFEFHLFSCLSLSKPVIDCSVLSE